MTHGLSVLHLPIVHRRTGASRVLIFDHTVRRQSPGGSTDRNLRGPVQRDHIDQLYSTSRLCVSHHLPDKADILLKGRVQIFNVWRSIKKVRRDPLAVAEASSVDDTSLFVTELIYPNRRGETHAVRYHLAHR